MDDLSATIAHAAVAAALSGVVRVDVEPAVERVVDLGVERGVDRGVDRESICLARGWANRAYRIPNEVDTRFGLASGTKSFTAVMVMRLVELGTLGLGTTARSLLGDDLPLIDDDVTVEHLLAHRSGLGDYVDENGDYGALDYVLSVPVHRLATTEDYLPALDGHPMVFTPGAEFRYCNSGYVVLALLAERAAAVPYHDLIQRHVFDPAGMTATAFLRSDELPSDAAIGYLHDEGLRSNVLHLPVRGSGDGGVYSTVADIHHFWAALLGGRLVGVDSLAELLRPRSTTASGRARYGLGFWLGATSDAVELEGGDAGVAFRSVNQPSRGVTYTVISNATGSAWRLADRLADLLTP